MTSPQIFGTICYCKQKSHSISFGNRTNANSFSIRTPQRTIRLQQNAACTNGMWGTNPREDRQTRNMGVSFNWRVVSLYLPRTLLHSHVSCQGNQKRTPFGHRPFQTQKHNKSHHHPRWQSNAIIGGVHQNNYRSHRRNNSIGGKRPPTHCKGNTGNTAQEQSTQ